MPRYSTLHSFCILGMLQRCVTLRACCRQEHAGADGTCAGRDHGTAARGGPHGRRADSLPGAGRGRCIQHHPRPDSRLGGRTVVSFSAGNAPDTNAILGEGPSCFRAPRLCLCFSVLLCSTAMFMLQRAATSTAMYAVWRAPVLHGYVCKPACSCAPYLCNPGGQRFTYWAVDLPLLCYMEACHSASAVLCMTWSQHSHRVTLQ